MIRVYISYAHTDRDFVNRLAGDLRRSRPEIEIWYDVLLPAGDSWVEGVVEQIKQANVILVILSPEYLVSSWAQEELNVALLRRMEGGARVIPALVRPCRPTGFLARLNWVDFTSDYDHALDTLIWGITGKKPRATKEVEPGTTSDAITPKEIEKLREELQDAVKLFRSRVEDSAAVEGLSKTVAPSNQRCFVVMPFGDSDLQVVYEDFVKPIIETECNLLCVRGDDVFGSNIIMDDILKSIRSAEIIVADLTRKNANVFYEVGICHALGKPVLLLSQTIDDVPFDLRHRRVLLYEYSPRGCRRLEATLKENVLAILADLKTDPEA